MNAEAAVDEFLICFFVTMFLWCAIGTLIGAIVGRHAKGRAADGAVCGGLLGLLGVLIFLLAAEDIRPKCPSCLAAVNRGASRCKHCGGQL